MLNFLPMRVTRLGLRSAATGEAAKSVDLVSPRMPCSEKRDEGGGEAKLPLSVPGTRPEVDDRGASMLALFGADVVDVVLIGIVVG